MMASAKFRIVFSLALTIVMMTLMFCTDRINDGVDDWAISVALSGIYPDSGLCLFVNVVLSKMSLFFNGLIPSINWFLMIELIFTFVAFMAFCYAALTFLPWGFALIAIAAVEYFCLPYCTYLLNFTFVAALCTLAGFFLLLGIYIRGKRNRKLSVLGVVLCACGYMVRSNAFLLALPFVAIALGWAVLCKIKKNKRIFGNDADGVGESADPCSPRDVRNGIFKGLVPIVCVGVCCAILWLGNALAWQSSEWHAWAELNESRAVISDYTMPPYEQVEDRLAPEGVSKWGYMLACNWSTADSEYFTDARMAAIASVSEAKSLESILSTATEYPFATDLSKRIVFFFVAMIIMLLIITPGKRRIPLLLLAILAVLCCAYFYGMGRLLNRIEFPVYLYSLIACFLVVGRDISFPGKRISQRSLEGCVGAVGVLGWCVITVHLILMLGGSFSLQQAYYQFNQQDFEPEGPLAQFALRDDDCIYAWNTIDYATDFETLYDHRYIPPADVLDRHIALGGWSTGSPFINARNEQIGMPNVIKGLVENEHARLVCMHEDFADTVLQFLREQYYPSAEMQIVGTVDNPERDTHFLIIDFSAGEVSE